MKKLFGFGLLFLLTLHLLGAIGFMNGRRNQTSADLAQAAWTQGYIAGQQAATGEDAPPPSAYTHGYNSYGHNGRHMSIFPAFGLLFICLLPLFLFGGMFVMIGPRRWGRCRPNGEEGGPPWGHRPPPWARHWGRHQGQHAPRWMREEEDNLPTEDEIDEKSPEDLEK